MYKMKQCHYYRSNWHILHNSLSAKNTQCHRNMCWTTGDPHQTIYLRAGFSQYQASTSALASERETKREREETAQST